MCDSVVVVAKGRLLLAKNSDRDPNEAQVLEWHPRRSHAPGARIRCTWIEVPQVAETSAVLISRPYRERIRDLKHLQGAAEARTTATVAGCVDLVTPLEEYPSWYPDVVRRVSVLRRGSDGVATEADVTLRIAIGPLKSDYELRIAVRGRREHEVILERLPYDESDREQFRVTWRFNPLDGFTEIRLQIEARLDVPRLVPLGGLGDRLAAGFVEAACKALESPA